jgi:hypothetical protein
MGKPIAPGQLKAKVSAAISKCQHLDAVWAGNENPQVIAI